MKQGLSALIGRQKICSGIRIVESAHDEGIDEGIKWGKIEGKIEAAKKMLKKGFDIETIIEITELSREQIEEFRD